MVELNAGQPETNPNKRLQQDLNPGQQLANPRPSLRDHVLYAFHSVRGLNINRSKPPVSRVRFPSLFNYQLIKSAFDAVLLYRKQLLGVFVCISFLISKKKVVSKCPSPQQTFPLYLFSAIVPNLLLFFLIPRKFTSLFTMKDAKKWT